MEPQDIQTKRRPTFEGDGFPGTDKHGTDASRSGIHPSQSGVFQRGLETKASRLHPGDILGESFTLERPIGKGTFGETWRAYDRSTGRSAVLKLIPKEFQAGSENDSSMRGVFRAVTGLRHSHICPLYRVGLDEACGSFLVSAFLEAVPLNDYYDHYIRNFATFPFNATIRIMWPVARSLDYAHAKSIIHRGLKMRNVMIGERCGVQVTDFTIPDVVRETLQIPFMDNGYLAESTFYRAPELWENHTPTARSDQFALAVIVYRLLAGRLPFHGKTEAELRDCVLEKEPAPIDGLHDSVNEVLARALGKDPKSRFGSCLAFLQVLVDAHKQGPHFMLTPEALRSGAKYGFLPLLLGTAIPLPREVAADKSTQTWPFKDRPFTEKANSTVGETIFRGGSYPYRKWTPKHWLIGGTVVGVSALALAGAIRMAEVLGIAPLVSRNAGEMTPPVVPAVSAPTGGGTDPAGGDPVAVPAIPPDSVPSGSSPDRSENGQENRESASTVFMVEEPGDLSPVELANLTQAANDGHAESGRRLGEMYLLGKNLPKDEILAAQWFQQAAEAGDAHSCFLTGRCFELGLGVEKSLPTAATWYQRGADKDDAGCLYRLGLCYVNGNGVARNTDKARELFQKAADLGHVQAKRMLDP